MTLAMGCSPVESLAMIVDCELAVSGSICHFSLHHYAWLGFSEIYNPRILTDVR